MDAIAAQVIASVLSSNLVRETVTGAGKLILESGKKLSKKVTDYMEKAEKGEIPNDEVPEDVQAEIKGSLKDILKGTSEPAYMDGVALFLEQGYELDENAKENLKKIFASAIDDEWEDDYDYPEGKEEYLKTVQEFVYGYCGNCVDEAFEIEDDVIYLNFDSDVEDYLREYRPDEIRKFITALNQLLTYENYGVRNIKRFTIY